MAHKDFRSKRLLARVQTRKHRRFPYLLVARLWARGETIATIAHTIGRIDRNNTKDPYHSLRNFLRRMHIGYTAQDGRLVRLPYRVTPQTVRASRKAGLRSA